jgi:hypothetical protein
MWRRLIPAAIGVAVALVIVLGWVLRRSAPRELPARETTAAVRFVRHDASGLVLKQGGIRDRARVRAIVDALGVDAHPAVQCPADYSHAEVSLVLSGAEIYVRKSVYLFDLADDAGVPTVLSTSSAGCHRGAPADVAALRQELALANVYP